jgi:hypothetical protein
MLSLERTMTMATVFTMSDEQRSETDRRLMARAASCPTLEMSRAKTAFQERKQAVGRNWNL